jgi:lysozyme
MIDEGVRIGAELCRRFEGFYPRPYLCPAGIPTIGYGSTEGVRMGQRFSVEECEDKLAARVIEHDDAVTRCLGRTPAIGPRTAFVSLSYNIGTTAFCQSTLVRKYKAGDLAGACAELSRWTYAKGVQWPGLVKRRAQERRICESGIM